MTTLMKRPNCAPTSPALRRANQEAEYLTGRPYLSHSQLSTFRGCPRKFAFIYVEKAKPEFQASSLLFGSAMHAVFEHHFRAILEGTIDAALSKPPETSAEESGGGGLLQVFLNSWKSEQELRGDVPIKYCKDEDFATITEMAQRMIAAFLASPLAQPRARSSASKSRSA